MNAHRVGYQTSDTVRGGTTEPTVCILCSGREAFAGGIGRFVANLMTELAKRHPGLEIVLIDTRGSRHIALAPFFFAVALLRILALVSRRKQVVIHANVSTHGSMVRKFVVISLATVLKVPVVLHLHAAIFEEFFSELPPFFKSLVRWMFRCASRVVVLGSNAKRIALDLGVPPNRIELIGNGVPRPLQSALALHRETNVPSITFLGRLCELKGVGDLLRALASFGLAGHEWHAMIAGDGDVAPYRLQAQQLGLPDRVDFLGWLSRDEVGDLLGGTTIFVLPSHAEGLPMAVLEALAHRVAVITTPVGGLPDWLVHEQSVLFVEPGDVAGLTAALLRLLTDGAFRAKLAQEGHEVFLRAFDIAGVSDRFAAIYRLVSAEPLRKRRPRHGEGPAAHYAE